MGVETEIGLLRALLASGVRAIPTTYASGKTTITRPANQTPYTALDVVGGAFAFGALGPAAGGEILITAAQLELDIAAVPAGMTTLFLYLYNLTPPSALADNAPFDLQAGDRASYVGKIALGTPIDEGSTCVVDTAGIGKQVTVPAGAVLFGYLVTTGGFTPAANSEVYKISLHAQDPS